MSVARLSRVLLGTAVVGALVSPALLAVNTGGLSLSASAKPVPAEKRKSSPPNVMFPVVNKTAKDLKSYGSRPGTEIKASCGSTVRAAHAGTAHVSSSKTSGKNLVKIVARDGKTSTFYGFMRSRTVKQGQSVKSGQKIGTVGDLGTARFCSLYFAVINPNKTNASTWLNTYVGKLLPVKSTLPPVEQDPGFMVAAFNVLGASHTAASKKSKYPSYSVRTPKQVAFLAKYKLDVIGLQEFQKKNRTAFLAAAKDTYSAFPSPTEDPKADSENSIIWRNSTMEFVSGTTLDVPYFEGRIRKMPVVELRQRSTGLTAYFINVHNPASVKPYGNQSKWRAKAIAIERAKVIELRKTGKAVFLTGDLNDREKAYCPLSAGGLMYSANTVPSTGACKMPKRASIDWVLVSGGTFSSYLQDWSGKDQKLTDHPIITSRAHLPR